MSRLDEPLPCGAPWDQVTGYWRDVITRMGIDPTPNSGQIAQAISGVSAATVKFFHSPKKKAPVSHISRASVRSGQA